MTRARGSFLFFIIFVAASLFFAFPLHAQDYPPYNQNQIDQSPSSQIQTGEFQSWLQGLASEAIADGVSPATVENALAPVTFDERVIDHDRNQPETTLTFATYSAHIITTDRVTEGRALLRKHARLLRDISRRYGVPPEIIVALWGMESNFGNNTGGYNTVNSLATLAYEGRRADFFRHQLIDALHILDEEHMPASELRGSWAGAMGQCQFMPSTYRRYAVDYDGAGRRDIWDNQADVFASIANYLKAEGWSKDLTWGREVRLGKGLPESTIGLDNKRLLADWQKLGVRSAGGTGLPKKPLQASLVQPDGLSGRSFLVYDNFRALMHWNRSTYFAASVGLLADKIRAR